MDGDARSLPDLPMTPSKGAPWTPPGSPPLVAVAVDAHVTNDELDHEQDRLDEDDDDGNETSDTRSIHSAPEFVSPPRPAVVPPAPPSAHASAPVVAPPRLPFSLWDYLMQEVMTVDIDGENEGVKSGRVTNFLSIPGEFEVVILFGVMVCLDSFLYTFTILPLRAAVALHNLVTNTFSNLFARTRRRLTLSHKCDLTKMLIVIATCAVLHKMTDASKMYHSVRGQETIKLYVIFNMFEIADRLCCSFGQDLQDSLYSKQTFARRTDGSRKHVRPVVLFGLTLAYTVAHTLVLFYQLVTLNVAINSYSNALLTLLLSNQFVEIKGSVFKKFEKENLFQMTCADIVERFQLGLMLFIIALRNLIELSSASSSTLFSFLPTSFASLSSFPAPPTISFLRTIFSPALVVLVSECIVDWLKHAFITKFNHIRPAVYGRFIDVLSKDLVSASNASSHDQPFVDQSPAVARRIGFAAIPLGCLVVRVISQAFEMLSDDSVIDECAPRYLSATTATTPMMTTSATGLGGPIWDHSFDPLWNSAARSAVVVLAVVVFWVVLAALKLTIGINLRAYAADRCSTMSLRVKEEQLNDRSRPKIGVSPAEQVVDRHVSQLVNGVDGEFDELVGLDADRASGNGGKGKRHVGLENLSSSAIPQSSFVHSFNTLRLIDSLNALQSDMAKHCKRRLDGEGKRIKKRSTAVEATTTPAATTAAATTTPAAVTTTPAAATTTTTPRPAVVTTSRPAAVTTTPVNNNNNNGGGQAYTTITRTSIYTAPGNTAYQTSVAGTRYTSYPAAGSYVAGGNASAVATQIANGGGYGPLTVVVVVSQLVPNTTSAVNTTSMSSTSMVTTTSTLPSSVPLTASISRSGIDAQNRTTNNGLSGGAIAGIVIGVLAGLLLLIALALLAFKRYRDNQRRDEMNDMMAPSENPYGGYEGEGGTGPEPSARYSFDEPGAPMSEARY